MPWTKDQFIEFCSRCGVDPKKALQEGKVDLRPVEEQKAPYIKGANKANRKIERRQANAVTSTFKVQDPERKSDQAVALVKKVFRQAEGMEPPKDRIRVSIIGLRVRPIDEDNFTAGCKGLIDGLVSSGIIPRDDWKTLEVRTSQQKVANWTEEGTILDLEFP